jgi:hypothetical protein
MALVESLSRGRPYDSADGGHAAVAAALVQINSETSASTRTASR